MMEKAQLILFTSTAGYKNVVLPIVSQILPALPHRTHIDQQAAYIPKQYSR